MVWHILRANILLFVNIILTDGIRIFLNTLTQKITTFFCSGIINLLFDGLAYNTSGHFAHCLYFSSPLRGSEKYYATRKISARIIYAKPLNKVYILHNQLLKPLNSIVEVQVSEVTSI